VRKPPRSASRSYPGCGAPGSAIERMEFHPSDVSA
jgi:hypothetical protein